jgi:hypothetical protein
MHPRFTPSVPAAAQAPETRFRIGAPNSQARLVRVVALDRHDDETRAAACARSNVQFSSVSELAELLDMGDVQRSGWSREMFAGSGRIATWLGAPDLAIIVGRDSDDATVAALAAQTWRRLGVTVSAVIRPAAAHPAVMDNVTTVRRSPTADLLRPWCTMLVLASSSAYLGDLLDALGAS